MLKTFSQLQDLPHKEHNTKGLWSEQERQTLHLGLVETWLRGRKAEEE
jgi:hypothetical protein